MTISREARHQTVEACLRDAGNPNPANPNHLPAWHDVAWRAIAILWSTADRYWPCWHCYIAAGHRYTDTCTHGTWNHAPPPVRVDR